ncbi:histidine kinase dimerization/phosphoacceptor domain -containing protein [Anoxynatronum buryatiense]|uniref:histidine kinase n=1 Tax=Anoxynatronum buryatiense TaxID=489973 RepID=A0AA45WV81_9CLOT|nr:histidine kinase dimerization/phosphoacceptor domain -containing protein [Anoxynatronum buryatiense]SMP52223.1 Two-component sensor histidine kinase, contains HisKA and HATPase domains [Anoxynatronum buryatiense]
MEGQLDRLMIKNNEKLLPQLMELFSCPVFVINETGYFVDVNQAGLAVAGGSKEEIIGRHESEWEEGKNIHFYRIPVKLGNQKKGFLIILVDNGDNPENRKTVRRYRVKQSSSKCLATQRQLKALLLEKELLLREVHHRIKNNMNNMVMMLTLQADSVGNAAAEEALKDARSRIQAMMVIYDKLYRSEDFHTLSVKTYLRELVNEVKGTFSKHERIRVHLEVDDMMLDSRILFPLGIMMNELFTNAMKYAYGEDQEGSVVISVFQMGDMIELVVQDFGKGMPEKMEKTGFGGFGLEMVEMLALQMSGSLTIERGNGVRFVVRIQRSKP